MMLASHTRRANKCPTDSPHPRRALPSRAARLVALAGGLLLTGGCMPGGFVIKPVTTNERLTEQTLYSESLFPAGKIAVIGLEGILLDAEKPALLRPGEQPVVVLLEQLDKARRDPWVKAVVLRINSPGGAVTAAELMHHEVLRFKKSGKPVVVMMMDVAASGGYYVACAADEIMACHSTVTGSIGVIVQLFEVTGTMQKIGISADAIKSAPMKAAGSPFEPLTPPERTMFQGIVDDLYGQFVAVVEAGRPKLSHDQVMAVADGRVFTADQALALGLIDRIGTMNGAIDRAKALAGIRTAKVVSYVRPYGYVANYYGHEPAGEPQGQAQVNLLNVDLGGWTDRYRPPFMYLWAHP